MINWSILEHHFFPSLRLNHFAYLDQIVCGFAQSKNVFQIIYLARDYPPLLCFSNTFNIFLFLVVPTWPNWFHPPHICKMIPQDCFCKLWKGIFANFDEGSFINEAKKAQRREIWHVFEWECLAVFLHNHKNSGSLCQIIHHHLFFAAIYRMEITNVVPIEVVWQQN